MTDGDRIRNLLGRYCDLMDTADWAGVGQLFANAIMIDDRSGNILVSGAAEVEQFYSSTVILHDGSPRTKHLVLNTVLEDPDGDGVAVALSSYLVLQAVGDEVPRSMITGRYVDRFSNDSDGTWRFAERRFAVDLTGDLSKHLRLST